MTADPRVLTFGETMALAVSERIGGFAHAPEARIGIGGSESNVAIGLRRLGIPSSWIGRVGDDGFGELIGRELRAEAVDATVITDPDHPTGFMVKERRRAEESRVSYYRSGSAGSQLTSADLPLDRIEEWSHLHVTGVTAALGDGPVSAIHDAVDAARASGVTVSFDLNYRSRLWPPGAAMSVYSALIPKCDLVVASIDEAKLVVGDGDGESLARALHELGAEATVVTDGPAGATAVLGAEILSLPARPVTVVDTVGAGDGFVAGFLAEWVTGNEPEQCLSSAISVGAFACLGPGDWESLPYRDEIDFLDRDPVLR